MEIEAECVPCLLKRVLFEARLVNSEKGREVIQECMSILNSRFRKGAVSAEVATEVHKRAYEILGTDDPYADVKKRSNEMAKKLLPKAEEIVEKKGFRGAALVAVVGNVLDFGFRDDYASPEDLEYKFEDLVKEDFGYDDLDRIEELLEDGERVVFFTDNCGEVVFDTLLLKKIKDHDVHLTVVVKGEPILTDATMDDALKYGIDEIADKLETTGAYAVGVNFEKLPKEVKDGLEESDLIIAKGMANWESFSEMDHSPIVFLTRSKCKPVADSMGVPFNKNVAKLFE